MAPPLTPKLLSRSARRKPAPYCLDLVFQCAKKARTILRGEACIVGLRACRFAQMPVQVAQPKRRPDAAVGKRLSRRAENAGTLVQAPRCEGNVSGDGN